MQVTTIGIDIGKNVFHLVGMGPRGRLVLQRRLHRAQLPLATANMPACLIGLEACPGAHHLARSLEAQGHRVRLLPPQYVRPYVKANKNDFRDAEAIAEAVGRATMRFVPVKTTAQLDLQALHRVRQRRIAERTALINQARAFLLEQGVPIRQGRPALKRELPKILADEALPLSGQMRALLQRLFGEWRHIDTQIHELTRELTDIAKADPACRRLLDVPGVGTLVATAIVAAIGSGSAFAKGWDFAAWLGLVPRQHSSGGKPRLLGISKRGNRYLRRLFILGAQAVARSSRRDRHRFDGWLTRLQTRGHRHVAVVALANKLARIAWAVLARGEAYRPVPAMPT